MDEQTASDPPLTDATRPVLPAPTPRTGANDWTAIDHLSVLDCFISPFRQLDDVPNDFTEAWALAEADVHENLLQQQTLTLGLACSNGS